MQSDLDKRLKRVRDDLSPLEVAFTGNPFRDLKKRFVIAVTPRVGSHLLCEGLLQHGVVVDEFFNPNKVVKKAGDLGLPTYEEHCRATIADVAPSGVFGVQGGLQVLLPLLESGEIPEHLADWQFVRLTRKNAVRQAISNYIAQKTSAWASFARPLRDITDDDYDGRAIARIMGDLGSHSDDWDEAFKRFGIEPFRITYEDLAADPTAVTQSVADFLGLTGPPITEARFLRKTFERQSTDINARWAKRFREEDRWRLVS